MHSPAPLPTAPRRPRRNARLLGGIRGSVAHAVATHARAGAPREASRARVERRGPPVKPAARRPAREGLEARAAGVAVARVTLLTLLRLARLAHVVRAGRHPVGEGDGLVHAAHLAALGPAVVVDRAPRLGVPQGPARVLTDGVACVAAAARRVAALVAVLLPHRVAAVEAGVVQPEERVVRRDGSDLGWECDHVAEREVVHGVMHELLVEQHPLLERHLAPGRRPRRVERPAQAAPLAAPVAGVRPAVGQPRLRLVPVAHRVARPAEHRAVEALVAAAAEPRAPEDQWVVRGHAHVARPLAGVAWVVPVRHGHAGLARCRDEGGDAIDVGVLLARHDPAARRDGPAIPGEQRVVAPDLLPRR
eukprot:scaffold59283_cov62-Phaeocystis_antarctica.AAC.4